MLLPPLSGVSSGEASGLGRPTVHFLLWLFPVPLPIPLGCDPIEIYPERKLEVDQLWDL